MITVVLGTKAQLIKMAPVMLEFDRRGLQWQWIFTGQHRDTIADLQRDFSLRAPDYQLYKGKDITRVGQMFWWSLRILWEFWRRRKVLFSNSKNSYVVVHGDTISTVLGAVAGRLAGCRVAHVESGLTSGKISQPFPEELQRRIVFRLTHIFFCPGQWAMNNVKKFNGEKIDTLQNTLVDSLALVRSKFIDKTVGDPYVLVNFHRFENLRDENRMRWIVERIEEASLRYRVVIVLHQPTEHALKRLGFFNRLQENPRITLKPRQTYNEFIRLLVSSVLLLTDGGSNQEECYYLGHPCVLLREVTERQEGIGGNAQLCNFSSQKFTEILAHPEKLRRPSVNTTESPVKIIIDWFTKNTSVATINLSSRASTDTTYWIKRHASYTDPLRSVGCRSLRPAANRVFYRRVGEVLKIVLDNIELPAGANVLDAGAGIGMYESVLLEQGLNVSATDISTVALEQLRVKFPEVQTEVADLTHLPFRDKSFQFVMCFDVLYHITDPIAWERSINELCRTSNEYIVLHGVWSNRAMVTKQHVRQHTSREVIEMLQRAGFELVKVQPTVRTFNFPWYFMRNIFPSFWYQLDRWQNQKSSLQLTGHAIAVFRRQEKGQPSQKQFITEDFTSKYTSANWIEKKLLDGYFRAVQQLIQHIPSVELRKVVEIGCGAGFSTERLLPIFSGNTDFEASEYLENLVSEARQRLPNIRVTQENIYHLNREDSSIDLLIALEVFEHLDNVEVGLLELRRTCRYAIIGVPNEPLWRILNMLRGKYLRSFGNTPGHINHWSGRSVQKLLERSGFQVVASRSPLPWTLLLVKSR